MPRRDGFDTNQEMLADFNHGAHLAYVDAFEREYENGVPDSFKDKPLQFIELEIERRPFDWQGVIDGAPGLTEELGLSDTLSRLIETQYQDKIRTETLGIHALTLSDVDFMINDHLTMRTLPEHAHEAFRQTANAIANLRIGDSAAIVRAVPANGIVADYTATLSDDPGGRSRHIGTLKEKPAKESIALGKAFVEDALDYIHSDQFVDRVSFNALREAVICAKTTSHRFTIPIRPDVPLNGHEPIRYLHAYQVKMRRGMEIRGERLQRLRDLGAPDTIIEYDALLYSEYKTALERVNAILDK